MEVAVKNLVKFLSVSVLLLMSGCGDKDNVKMPLPLVSGAKAHRMNVPLTIEVPAKITGSFEIQVRAQVNGILKTRLFKEGQYVQEGEKLFIIDQAPYLAAVTRAQGNLAQAESEAKRSQRDFKRVKKLFEVGAVSQKEYDDVLSVYERAMANVKMAQGSLHEAEINLGYTEVKAPISGIVRKEAQSIGNLVSVAGESGLLTSMVQVCPLHANFSVSGSVWASLNKGMREGQIKMPSPKDYVVEVVMADGSVYPRKGRVIFIDSSEDNYTSSVQFKAEIPNDKDQQTLLPGQFVRIRVIGIEYQNAVVVPASSVILSQVGSMVYVVRGDKTVAVRPVKAETIGNYAVIHDGLSEGEVVISEGIVKARPGQAVNAVLKQEQE
jgi:membrane fusion protein (multidrug efflux system)